jgi:hypothetical protein
MLIICIRSQVIKIVFKKLDKPQASLLFKEMKISTSKHVISYP